MSSKDSSGEWVYLMKGPALSRAEAETFGGFYRAVDFESLAGNKAITQSYYDRLLSLPERDHSQPLPFEVSNIQYEQHADHIARLMRVLPPDPMSDLDLNGPIGRANAHAWWGSGKDLELDRSRPPTADAFARAVAAANLSKGAVLFGFDGDAVLGGGVDIDGRKLLARRPTTFDALWGTQNNPNADTTQGFGFTTPDPMDASVHATREVVLPPVTVGQAKTRILLR